MLGERGADAAPGDGDGLCPAPGCVDAQPGLSGAAGDAGGDVQHPVAEGADFAVRELGCSVKPMSLAEAIRSVAAMMIKRERDELVGSLRDESGLRRLLRRTKAGLLRTCDPTPSTEDLAVA